MGEAEVIAEQQKSSYKPYGRALIDVGAGIEFGTITRIKRIKQILEPYRETCEILLNNNDSYMNSLNLKGEELTLGFGFLITGEPDYIDQPLLRIVDQQYDSRPGVSTCTLICRGIVDLMKDDRADSEYTASDTIYPSQLVDLMLANPYSVYKNSLQYTIDWTKITKATDIDFYQPGNFFKIYLNSTRLTMLRKLLDNSYVFPRGTAAGTIEFIKPVTSGTSYDYEYELGGTHTFFQKQKITRTPYPGGITVYGGEYDDEAQQYTYSGSYGSGEKAFYHIPNLQSNSECEKVAQAIMSVFNQERESCVAEVPINCNAKLYDYVKITDIRDGNTAIGNIGHITRILEKGRYRMQIKYGGWRSDRTISELMAGVTKEAPMPKAFISVSCPETYLGVNEYIDFHIFHMNATLYFKAYSVAKTVPSGSATVRLRVVRGTSTLVWEQEASIWKKLYNPVVILSANDTVRFRIRNEGPNAAYVNGMVVYSIA